MPPQEIHTTVSIVIPTWNRRDLVLRLLDLLEGQTRPPNEVIVVDNGSNDGTADAVASRATVIRLTDNSGFAHAVNLGILAAKGEWVGILNNDVEPRLDWLELLLLTKSDFATGKLLNLKRPDEIDGTFDLLSQVAVPWRAGHGRPDQPTFNYTRSIQFAPWTAVLYRRRVFDQIGLLDESFGSYYEDVDFGIRCALAGIEGEYQPQAVAFHLGSGTLGAWRPATVQLLTRNHRLLIQKHFGPKLEWPLKCRSWLAQVLWAMLAARHGQWRAWWRGRREPLPATPASLHPLPLRRILRESERELYRLQKETGFDLYWRMYFSLFPPS
ncbi:MAG: glycosyltransferase family 2 protein [Bryobacteraceae bacterium]|nr:glycosyltransferase family 2 protein [Bryobacteraceae bacterium]